MLVFQTQFAVDNNSSIDQLLNIWITWLDGSPNSNFSKTHFDQILDEFSFQLDKELVHIIKCKNDAYEGIGFRYEKEGDQDDNWITEIVGAKFDNEYKIGIQVHWNSTQPSRQTPRTKKPYIIKQIFDGLGGGKDGNLKVLDKAYYLKESDLEFVGKIIGNEASNTMPVVYISVKENNSSYVNSNIVAHHLVGMAHVLVEPNRDFSYSLMEVTSRKNVYLGAVGIYWPDGVSNTRLLPDGKYQSAKDLEIDISNKIRDALITQRVRRELTWFYVKELSFKIKLKSLQEEGSTELSKYINTFDGEIEAKEEQLRDAESQINQLRHHINELTKEENNHTGDSLLTKGNEKELYQNEYTDLIISILEKEVSLCENGSRKSTLIDSLLSVNQSSGRKDEIMENLKSIFDNYTRMGPKEKQILQNIGFSITEDGKHYKLIYKNDSRYQFTTSKTTSDHRAGKNFLSTIKNKIFY